MFTVGTNSPPRASTVVSIDQIGARSPVLAGVAGALVNLRVAKLPGVALSASADEGVLAVDATSIVTVDPSTIVHVHLAVLAIVAFEAEALVPINLIHTTPSILTGAGLAFIHVYGASRSGETIRTTAGELSDFIFANPSVQTWLVSAFIDIFLTTGSSVTLHADALKSPTLIQASSVVQARVGQTFVDVDFAPRSVEADRTIAAVRPRSVGASPAMFAWRSPTLLAFVVVLLAIVSVPSWLARADELPVDGRSLAYGPTLARVADAGVV